MPWTLQLNPHAPGLSLHALDLAAQTPCPQPLAPPLSTSAASGSGAAELPGRGDGAVPKGIWQNREGARVVCAARHGVCDQDALQHGRARG
eukprot:297026-Chlamydomonas_euryale.AAC.1